MTELNNKDNRIEKLTRLLQEELNLSEEILKITKDIDREIEAKNIKKVQEILNSRGKRLDKLKEIEQDILKLTGTEKEKSSDLKINENIQNLIKSIKNILEGISSLNKLYTKRLKILEDDYSNSIKLMEIKKKK